MRKNTHLGDPADTPRGSERFRTIFEHSNDAIFIVDPERDAILDVNGKVARMLGYSRNELLRLPLSAVHPDEMPKFLSFARSVLDHGTGWTDELSCVTKCGDRVAAEISASAIDLGARTGVIAMARDVTERKRAQATLERYAADLQVLVEGSTTLLHRSEQRYRVLLEINNAIIASLGQDALLAAIAGALRRILSFDRASLALHDVQRGVVHVHTLAGISTPNSTPTGGMDLPREGSYLEVLPGEGRPIVRRDLRKECRATMEHRLLDEGILSYVAAPLIAKNTVIGSLSVESRKAERYSEDEAEFLVDVAKQVGLAVENMLAYEEVARLKARLEQENLYLQEEVKTEHNFEDIIGHSQPMRKVLTALETVAPTDATVLITGETGTGKELAARAIHMLSPRRDHALVKVNCAALPATLIESELFGHERGAFTGAVARKIGRFELADGGTIFLDEIGDLSMDLQAKLLRVLQDGAFERVGGSHTIKVNARVIAATNHDLEKAQQDDQFRADLYYRLNVFPIDMPPLRNRREDIPLLVRSLVAKHRRKLQRHIVTIPQHVMDALTAYPWPGNVRELENVIERAIILSRGSQLELGESALRPPKAGRRPVSPTLQDVEREHIIDTLKATAWRVSGQWGAANRLGLKRTTLEARMKKLGIRRPRSSPANISSVDPNSSTLPLPT